MRHRRLYRAVVGITVLATAALAGTSAGAATRTETYGGYMFYSACHNQHELVKYADLPDKITACYQLKRANGQPSKWFFTATWY